MRRGTHTPKTPAGGARRGQMRGGGPPAGARGGAFAGGRGRGGGWARTGGVLSVRGGGARGRQRSSCPLIGPPALADFPGFAGHQELRDVSLPAIGDRLLLLLDDE